MDEEIKLMSHQSGILEKVVYETLVTCPEDAHVRIVDYLKMKNGTSEEIELFKQTWSKVVANNESFGRKNQKIDPSLFTKELVQELRKHQPEVQEFQQIFQSLQILNEQLSGLDTKKERSGLEVQHLHEAVKAHEKLTKTVFAAVEAVYAMPPSFLARSYEQFEQDSSHLEEYIDSTQKAKIKWDKVNIKPESREVQFDPVHDKKLGKHSYRTGFLTIPLKKDKQKTELEFENFNDSSAFQSSAANKQTVIIPKYFSTDSVLGLEVFYDNSLNQDTAWTVYSQFTSLSICRYFNPFPKPVNYDYNEDGVGSVIFIYENPNPLQLRDFLLPTGRLNSSQSSSNFTVMNLIPLEFPNLLRKYPSIPLVWATQLAVAARHIAHLATSYIVPFSIFHDTFVTSDGTLLLGGLEFWDYLPHLPDEELLDLTRSGIPDERNDNNQRHHNLEKFTDCIVYPILSHVLGTSRTVHYIVPTVYSFKTVGSGLNNPNLTFFTLKDPETIPPMNLYPTFYVCEGSCLAINLICCDVKIPRIFKYEEIFGKQKEKKEYFENEENFLTKPFPEEDSTIFNKQDLGEHSIPSLNTEFSENNNMKNSNYYNNEKENEKNTGNYGNDNNNNNNNSNKPINLLDYFFDGPVDFNQLYNCISIIYTVEECEKPDYNPEIQCLLDTHIDPYDQKRERPRVRLVVKSLYPCVINCEIVTFEINNTNLEKSKRNWGCVRIQFFPTKLTSSVELQDLIFHLEEYYNYELLTTVYNSACFLTAYDKSMNDSYSKNMIVECCHEWGLLRKDLEKLSNMHEMY